jgi:glucose-fructose oxidoreductase
VYPVQAACYITGETPIRASGVAASTRDVYRPGIEETMAYTLEFPSGAVAQCRASYAYSAHQFTVSADNGTFACTSTPSGGNVFGQSSRGKPNPKQVVLPKNQLFKADDTLQLAVLHDRFADAVRNRTPFACPGEMGLRDIRIVEAVYASVGLGGKIVPVKA